MLRISRCMVAKGGPRNKSAWITKQILASQVADVVLSIKSRAVMKSRPWVLLELSEPIIFSREQKYFATPENQHVVRREKCTWTHLIPDARKSQPPSSKLKQGPRYMISIKHITTSKNKSALPTLKKGWFMWTVGVSFLQQHLDRWPALPGRCFKLRNWRNVGNVPSANKSRSNFLGTIIQSYMQVTSTR